MSESYELGKIIGKAINDSKSYKETFVLSESVTDINLRPLHTVVCEASSFVYQQNIGDHFVLDHPVACNLDSSLAGTLPSPYLHNGLIAYYPLEVDAKDKLSGKSALVNGAVLVSSVSPFGSGSYYFDGVDDNIQIPASVTNSLTSGAVCCWVKFSDENADYNIFAKNTARFRCQYNNVSDDIYFQVNNESTLYTVLNADWTRWTHLVLTWNGTNKYIIVNGVLRASAVAASITPASGNLYLGQNSVNNTETLKGYLSNIGIYNRYVSPTEATRMYSFGNGLEFNASNYYSYGRFQLDTGLGSRDLVESTQLN